MHLTLPAPLSIRPAMEWLLRLRLPISHRQTVATGPMEPRELPKDATWVLPQPGGMRIECLSGELWITQDWQRRDVLLAPGQSYAVEGTHQLLVHALRSARFQVHLA